MENALWRWCFCPYRASVPWCPKTQGDALGYELVGLSGRFAPPLRRHRSYGSSHRARMAKGQSSKAPPRPGQQAATESAPMGQQAATESAPTGQQALSPGQRPGYVCNQYMRPERAKALWKKHYEKIL